MEYIEKLQQLTQAKSDKLSALMGKVDTTTASQLQEELGSLLNKQVYTDTTGNRYQQQMVDGKMVQTPFTGATRNLYIDNTANGEMKLGVANTAKGGFEGRYNEDMGGWKPGEKGVTVQDGALMDVVLPYNEATTYENKVNRNVGMINSRVGNKDEYGSGYTEYTSADAPLWNLDSQASRSINVDTYVPKLDSMNALKEQQLQEQDIAGRLAKTYDASEGRLGEDIDLAQSQGLKLWADMANMMRKGSRAVAGQVFDEETVDKWLPIDARLLGTDYNVQEIRKDEQLRDRLTSFGSRDEFNREQEEFAKSVAEGSYGKAAWNALMNLDRHLANSAPEMATMMIPYGGLPAVVFMRHSNHREEFAANNDREMTLDESLKDIAGITATLVPEKVLIATGAGKVFDKILKGTKGTTGEKVRDAAIGVGVSGAGEAVQEAAESVQERYATQKVGEKSLEEIIKSDETIGSAIAGGVVSGGLRGIGEAVPVATDVVSGGVGLVGEGVSKTTGAIKDYVEKRELGKVEKETTKASKAYEEAVVSSEDLFNEYMKVGTQYLKEQEAGNVSEATEKAARDIAAKMAASEYIGTDDAEQIYQAMKNSSLDETNSDLNSEEPEKIQTVTNNPEKYFGSSQKDLDVVKMRDWITNSVSKGILSENDAKSVMDKLGIDEDIKDTVVLEASKLKQAKQELNKKSMSDVAEEVSTGSRGFVTYFDGAMKGLKINNDKLVQSGMDNLNRLHQLQGQKIGIIDESIQMVRDEINSRLAMVSDRNTGLKNFMRSDIERSPETIGLGYKVKIKIGTIAEQMYNEENGIDKSVDGIYDLRRQVQKEYDAMTVMKDYLDSRVSVKVEEKPVTKTTEKKDSVYTEIDKAIANGWTAEELKATNEKVVSSIKDEKTREKKLIELNDYVDLKMSQPEQEVVTEYKPEANEIVEQAETKQEFDTITNKDEFIGMVSKLPISEDVLAKVKELMKDCE